MSPISTTAAWLAQPQARRLQTLADDVAGGLRAKPKRLPPYLFYDDEGSRLFEQITELPEYYLTRAERSIFVDHGRDIVRLASDGGGHPLSVVELGAGTATKSEILLGRIVELQGNCRYWPVDVSQAPLEAAQSRIATMQPDVSVVPLVMHHEQAFEEIRQLEPRQLVLFIGSSIGNYEPADAVRLLRGIRGAVHSDGLLLLGTDMCKSPETLLAAYDDLAGVTAQFNLNVLARINRELGGHFVLDRFRHVALFRESRSRIEMHLESTTDQLVRIDALDLEIPFRKTERIHTESSHKYDMPSVANLLACSGFELRHTFWDKHKRFAVHLASAV